MKQRRLLAIILVLAMMLTLLPLGALATSQVQAIDGDIIPVEWIHFLDEDINVSSPFGFAQLRILPHDATNQNVVLTSSDPSVTVTPMFAFGELAGIQIQSAPAPYAREVTITATTVDGGFTSSMIARILPQTGGGAGGGAPLETPDLIRNIFPDLVLAEEIASRLGLSVDDTVAQVDLIAISNLSVSSSEVIYSLEGVQFLHSLRTLYLFGDSRISDLTPLTGLALEELYIASAYMTDFTPISSLRNLQALYLMGVFQTLPEEHGQLEDLSFLTGLSQLTSLNLTFNQISDLTPLASLTGLTHLRLSENQISDVTPLAALINLEQLELHGNQILDFRPLADLALVSMGAWEQEITLAPIARADEIRLENMVFGLDGNLLAPETISHGGRYEAPYIIWNNVSDNEVHFTFIDEGTDHRATGTVTQPVETATQTGRTIRNIFPDLVLAELVAEALGLNIEDTVTQAQLDEILEIGDFMTDVVFTQRIESIEGIQYLRELQTAVFHFVTEVSDLTPLARLQNLHTLFLASAGNIDLSDLAGMDSLRDLRLIGMDQALVGNGLAPLLELSNLQELALNRFQISDISPLAGLVGLEILDLSWNEISDLSPLAGLTNLEILHLSWNEISDLSPLVGLTNLVVLDVTANEISNLSPLAELTNLGNLQLGLNEISDLAPLAGLVDLFWLSLNDNEISDLSPLAELTNLMLLMLDFNEISDLSPLAELTNLEILSASANEISDLSPLAERTNLRGLTLEHNEISDVRPLAGLINLEWLLLNDNQISDISPLVNLEQLQDLWAIRQTITLAPITLADEIRVENTIFDMNGNLVAPQIIEDGGRYESPYVIWENHDGGDVSFIFWHNLLMSPQSEFAGTVIQPVETVIEQPIPVTGVSINLAEEFSTGIGQNTQVIATVAPQNATNQNVTWHSSNPSVVSITEAGVLTGHIAGTAVITVTTEDGSFTANSRVTVLAPSGGGTPGGGGGGGFIPQPPQAPDVDDEDEDETQAPPSGDFADVTGDSWYYSYVRFVAEGGIMQGVGDGNFAPNVSLDRSMLATILWRIAGQPSVTGNSDFADVRPGMWYTDAITWAQENGVVQGVGAGQFAPGQNITREEFALMMFRFAEATGENTIVPEDFDLTQFTDAGDISSWAKEAFEWAVYRGLISGTSSTTLAPSGSATRAETAAILTRFLED